jgi:hypothetical protein
MTVAKFGVCTLLFFLAACGYGPPDIPSHLPQPEEMTKILLDVHLVEGAKTGQTIVGDTLAADYYYEAVYRKYNITRAILDEAITFYTKHPKIMEPMYDHIIETLSVMDAEAEKAIKERRDNNPAVDVAIAQKSADSLRAVFEKTAKILGGGSQSAE